MSWTPRRRCFRKEGDRVNVSRISGHSDLGKRTPDGGEGDDALRECSRRAGDQYTQLFQGVLHKLDQNLGAIPCCFLSLCLTLGKFLSFRFSVLCR